MALTAKQQAFVDQYAIDRNATQAAIRAGYAEGSARQTGHDLLQKPDVAAAVAAKLAQASEAAGITAEMVRRELGTVAFSRIDDFAVWDEDSVTLIPSADLDPAKIGAIREITARVETVDGETSTRTTRHLTVKQHDKIRALELLGKDQGMFTPRIEIDLGLAEMFEQIRENARASE